MDSNIMKLLPLDKLGARASEENPYLLKFGIFLPEINESDGNSLKVKIIHEEDQLLQEINPHEFQLEYIGNDTYYGAYWAAYNVDIRKHNKLHKDSKWGEPGKYVYRYCLKNLNYAQEHPEQPEIDWIIDPFAREFGVGKQSAITLEYKDYQWREHENNEWKIPDLKELVIYELMINEFAEGIKGTIEKLDYLADLGVNCIELMPISNVANSIDWGYKPIGYFGVDERFGNSENLKELIDEAHKRKIAVILDVVYAHTHKNFAYSYVYRELGKANPFMGAFAGNGFGLDDECTDFKQKFTQDFFFTVNHYWLEHYHLDGFRYDYVPGYWDGSIGKGYANLTYSTYQAVKNQYQTVKEKKEGWENWQRFFQNDTINLIQCAEHLDMPKEILQQSYSNCTWQNQTWYAAKEVAQGNEAQLSNLGFQLGLFGYPSEVTTNDDKISKTALQYIENHDHARFVCHFGTQNPDHDGNGLLQEGDRDNHWFKIQPYLIGMLTAKGVPMLWQGQELGENYYLPEGLSWGRVALFRPVRWDYFYDRIGKTMISLVRKLIKLRKQPQFCSLNDDTYYFHNHYAHYQSKGVLIFSRKHENHFSIVALNFGSDDQTVQFRFPDDKNFQLPEEYSGNYREELHGKDYPKLNLKGITKDGEHQLEIPSNYGRIWTLETST
jgi:1,4-alpha-glucan branching enzyme